MKFYNNTSTYICIIFILFKSTSNVNDVNNNTMCVGEIIKIQKVMKIQNGYRSFSTENNISVILIHISWLYNYFKPYCLFIYYSKFFINWKSKQQPTMPL